MLFIVCQRVKANVRPSHLELEIEDPVSVAGSAQPEAVGPLQEFPLSGGQLDPALRVVAKVEHHAGELFPRVGFVVTNLRLRSRAIVRF